MKSFCIVCGQPEGIAHICAGLPSTIVDGWSDDRPKLLTEISQLKDELRQTETVLARAIRDRDQYLKQLRVVQERCTELLDQYRAIKRAGGSLVMAWDDSLPLPADWGLMAEFYDHMDELRRLTESLDDRLKRSVEQAKHEPPVYLGSFAEYAKDDDE